MGLLALMVFLVVVNMEAESTGIQGKLNDTCKNDDDCLVTGGWCNPNYQMCKCLDEYIQKSLFLCVKASALGDPCMYDLQCRHKDKYSLCTIYKHSYVCRCRRNYQPDLVNGSEVCTLGRQDIQHITIHDISAAPLILGITACVLVETLCLLACRYWVKLRTRSAIHRHVETLTRQQAGNLAPGQPQLLPLTAAFTPLPPNLYLHCHPQQTALLSPIGSTYVNSTIPGHFVPTPASPPITDIPVRHGRLVAEALSPAPEDPPPSYEEAIKMLAMQPDFFLDITKSAEKPKDIREDVGNDSPSTKSPEGCPEWQEH